MNLYSTNFASANLLGANLAGATLTGLGPDGFLNTVCPDGHVGDCCNHYVGGAPADCSQ